MTETEQEERTEWAIQAYTSVCSFRDGPECFHPDNKNQRWRCVFSNCPIKVTGAKEKVIGMIETEIEARDRTLTEMKTKMKSKRNRTGIYYHLEGDIRTLNWVLKILREQNDGVV